MSKLITDKVKTTTGSEITLPSTWTTNQVLRSDSNVLSAEDYSDNYYSYAFDHDRDGNVSYVEYTFENNFADLDMLEFRLDALRVSGGTNTYMRPVFTMVDADGTELAVVSRLFVFYYYNATSNSEIRTATTTNSYLISNLTSNIAVRRGTSLIDGVCGSFMMTFHPGQGNKAGQITTSDVSHRANGFASYDNKFVNSIVVHSPRPDYATFDAVTNKPNFFLEDSNPPVAIRFYPDINDKATAEWAGGSLSIREIKGADYV